MFKVNNKSMTVKSMTYLTPFFSVTIVDFEQVNVICRTRKTSGTDFSKVRVQVYDLEHFQNGTFDSHFQQLCLSSANTISPDILIRLFDKCHNDRISQLKSYGILFHSTRPLTICVISMWLRQPFIWRWICWMNSVYDIEDSVRSSIKLLRNRVRLRLSSLK